MGKFKRAKPSEISMKSTLEEDIQNAQYAKQKNRNKVRPRQEEEEYVSSSLSKKILSAARKQKQELEGQDDEQQHKSLRAHKWLEDLNPDGLESDEELDSQPTDTFYEDVQVNEDDEKAMQLFMSKNPVPQRTLADIILEKITERQTELDTQFSDAGEIQIQNVDPKLTTLYEGVRDVLKIYRSGKLPKAFKIIPTLLNWEQMLYITEPQCWSAASMYQGTRIFTSNLKETLAQRFFTLVLLPRVRDDIAEYKRLNFHLYQAVRKALYKPGAFMKGIILPLLESGNCSLREAIIIGSIVARSSIPMLHSSVAMLKIADMDYTGANSIFLRIFLDKKYALPYRVVDGLVSHFMRFAMDSRELPVLWHQAYLTFVQRYKADISTEQRELLLDLLEKHNHYLITPEIRRELVNAKCRDAEDATPPMDFEDCD
uniref:Bystin n=1 Tax=Dendroctonus ponderosae TaxID=77166 RepID=J3JY75_DENPD|nr:unknown [Dendroctonus ponderosae]